MVDWKGGFRPELFTDDVTEFICPACSGVLSNPILLKKCGHIYCDTCLRYMRTKGSFCLICDKKIFANDCNSERQIHKIIQGLVVACPYVATKGCEWNASLFELNQHIYVAHT